MYGDRDDRIQDKADYQEQDMKHTPGPWKIIDYGWTPPAGGDWAGRIEGANGAAVYAGAASFNAICHLADARLIAAAPELLAACEGIETVYAELQSAMPGIVGTPSYVIVVDAVSRARRAIAAAKGE